MKSIRLYTDSPENNILLPTNQVPQSDDNWWGKRLLQKGIAAEDVEFLVRVLDPDPNKRLSAADLIGSGYLEVQKKM